MIRQEVRREERGRESLQSDVQRSIAIRVGFGEGRKSPCIALIESERNVKIPMRNQLPLVERGVLFSPAIRN